MPQDEKISAAGVPSGDDLPVATFPCQNEACVRPAELFCPTCARLALPKATAAFCSKSCFTAAWPTHKALHASLSATRREIASAGASVAKTFRAERSSSGASIPYDPFTPQFAYTGLLRAFYPLSPRRNVPAHIPRSDYADSGAPLAEERERRARRPPAVLSVIDSAIMRRVCRLGREVLDAAAAAVAPGVTTDAIDAVVHAACVERGCYPSPLNYVGFPKSVCTSVNEVICHGIPDRRPLCAGDIVNIDVSVYKDGFHADLNETYLVPAPLKKSATEDSEESALQPPPSPPSPVVDPRVRSVVDTSRECLKRAIDFVRPGRLYRDLGGVIERTARERGFSVNRTYCGHGINRLFHCAPNVPHYADNKAVGTIKIGHVFTIEPMICEGDHRDEHWPDGWTAVTKDGKLSAQFEHTLLVTQSGCEVLTRAVGHDVVLDGLPVGIWGKVEERSKPKKS